MIIQPLVSVWIRCLYGHYSLNAFTSKKKKKKKYNEIPIPCSISDFLAYQLFSWSMSDDRVFDDFKEVTNANCLYFFYVNFSHTLDHWLDQYNFEVCSRLLPIDKQIKLRNIKNSKLRVSKLISSLLLKYIIVCMDRDKKSWHELKFGCGKYGKPFLSNRDCCYNSTDEAQICSVCISWNNESVGVDLSDPQDIENFKLKDLHDFYRNSFKDIFTGAEIGNLDRLFDHCDRQKQLQILTQYWALKECRSKLDGFGLHLGLQRYQFNAISNPVEFKYDNKSSAFNIQDNIPLKPIGDISGICFHMPNSQLIGCTMCEKSKYVRIIEVDSLLMIDFLVNI